MQSKIIGSENFKHLAAHENILLKLSGLNSVTRLGNLLSFGRLFKACGSIFYPNSSPVWQLFGANYRWGQILSIFFVILP